MRKHQWILLLGFGLISMLDAASVNINECKIHVPAVRYKVSLAVDHPLSLSKEHSDIHGRRRGKGSTAGYVIDIDGSPWSMAPHDDGSSDEDADDYTTTNVVLGYASKEPTDDPISQLGGRPVGSFGILA